MKMRKRAYLWVVLSVIIVLMIIVIVSLCGNYLFSEKENRLETIEIKQYNIQETCNVSGVVHSNSVTLDTTCNEKIDTMYVSLGDRIKKGTVICDFDVSSFNKEIEQLNDELEELITNKQKQQKIFLLNKARKREQYNIEYKYVSMRLKEAKEQKITFRKMIKKIEKCLKSDEWSEKIEDKDLGDYQKVYDLEKNKILKLQEEISSLKRKKDTLKKKIDKTENMIFNTKTMEQSKKKLEKQISEYESKKAECRLISNIDGIVTEVYGEEGENAVGGKVIQITANPADCVTAYVDEKDIYKIKEGQQAIVINNAENMKKYFGTVIEIKNIVENGKGIIEVRLDSGQENNLIIGQQIAVNILLEEKKTIVCPYDFIEEDESGNCFVYKVLRAENNKLKIQKNEIETGLDDGYYVEIKGNNVEIGDQIVSPGDVEME